MTVVVEQFEATIQGGSVDVLAELVESGSGSRYVQAAITNLEDEDGLDLTLKDLGKLRDLADQLIAALSPSKAEAPDA